MHPSKADLRATIRAARRARPPADRAAAARGILAVLERSGALATAPAIAAYIAAPGEPDPALVRAVVIAAGGRVLLPVPHRGRRLAWARDEGRSLADARLPVDVPAGPELGSGAAGLLAADVALVLVPALAVSLDGSRLGQGGGYYDGLLAELPGTVRALAVVHDDEVLPRGAIPREPHDRAVTGAVTPTRLWDLSGSGGGR